MTWSYIWLALLLKIPAVGMVWLVWWALRQRNEAPVNAPASEEDGGSKRRRMPHPRPPLPTRPRRGPHGAAAPPPPPRVRSVNARARTVPR
jgi:hypothetical protein